MITLKKKINIAVDGFSSCGKSSYAKSIANELAYIYIDSGAMYRAVTLYAIENGLLKEKKINEDGLERIISNIQISFTYQNKNITTFLNGRNVEKQIRDREVSDAVSLISKLDFVRKYLVHQQQIIGAEKGVVMDGRDIGTVVFPDAEIKIYMTASAEIRAQRRFKELQEKHMTANYDDVLQNIKLRDENDINRSNSPLLQADDAIVLDNSHMAFDEQMVWFKDLLISKDLLVE